MTGLSRADLQAELADIPIVIEELGQPAVSGGATFRVVVDALDPRGTLGEVDRGATHELYFAYRPDYPLAGSHSLVVSGVEYLPVGPAVDYGDLHVALVVPCVRLDVFMRGVLTVQAVSGGVEDRLTGATGAGTTRTLLIQPCGEVEASALLRAVISDGVQGRAPTSVVYTRVLPALDVQPGETLAYLVNGRWRPLLRQGAPLVLAGQEGVLRLEFGPPEDP